MKRFNGVVSNKTYGYASGNLREVMHLIEQRMGIPKLVEGTLNVAISEDYIVAPRAIISVEENTPNRHKRDERDDQACAVRHCWAESRDNAPRHS